jgi:hypothetical protein
MDTLMINGIKAFAKDKLKQIKYTDYLPTKQKNSDVYIVEFPKGGITWFSTIVANINLIESNSKQRATYFNIQQLIPDIHMNRNILDEPMWDTPKSRFIKSHHEWCPYYNHVIYLVRNPVSVMNSYYHYTTMLNIFNGTFEEFIKDKRFGLETWKCHVESWLLRGESSQRIHMIKYEDLKEKPLDTLKSLYFNLGLKIDDSIILDAIELSNFENMKITENHYKRFNPNSSLVFVREGKSKVEIDKKVEKHILDNTVEIREKLGY